MKTGARCCLTLVLLAAGAALPAGARPGEPQGGAVQSADGTLSWKCSCPGPAQAPPAKTGNDVRATTVTALGTLLLAIVIALTAAYVTRKVLSTRELAIRADLEKAKLREAHDDAEGVIERCCILISALAGQVADDSVRGRLASKLGKLGAMMSKGQGVSRSGV